MVNLEKDLKINLNKPKAPDFPIASKPKPPTKGFDIPTWTEPLPGLVPLGDTGFWITPLDPVDPTNCDLYPDSFWCGGIPLTWKPTFGIPGMGVDVELVLDGCNLGIQVTPVVAFIKLPPFQLVLKDTTSDGCKPNFPGMGESNDPDEPGSLIMPPLPPGCGYAFVYGRGDSFLGWGANCSAHGWKWTSPYNSFSYAGSVGVYSSIMLYDQATPEAEYGGQQMTVGRGFTYSNVIPAKKFYRGNSSVPEYWAIQCAYMVCENVEAPPQASWPFPNLNPPPPLIPPPKTMDCCDLVAVLLEKVIRLEEAIGVNEYPASLPASLISKNEGFIGNLIPNPPVEINSLTSLVGWCVERFDEIMGEWEIPIQIKDVDPTTPGDQPKGVKLPNLAEAVAEIFSMCFQNTVNNDLIINIVTRNLVESGQIKQQDFKAYGLLQTLVDYFNYDYKDVSKDLALSFEPNKINFDEMLKEAIVKVSYPEYNDKDDFKKSLQRLLESAAIIKAVNWRKIDTKGDVKAQFIEKIKAQAEQLQKETLRQNESLDSFLIEAELGFPATPGMPDPDQPYGESFEERPIIKKLQEEK